MKKVKLGVLPYIIILCCLAVAIVKIRDTRLLDSSAQVTPTNSLQLIGKDEWNNLQQNTEKIKNESYKKRWKGSRI